MRFRQGHGASDHPWNLPPKACHPLTRQTPICQQRLLWLTFNEGVLAEDQPKRADSISETTARSSRASIKVVRRRWRSHPHLHLYHTDRRTLGPQRLQHALDSKHQSGTLCRIAPFVESSALHRGQEPDGGRSGRAPKHVAILVVHRYQ